MVKFLLLLILTKLGSSYIYYDTGMIYDLDFEHDSSFNCQNGVSKVVTKTFSNQFEQIPQVFFTFEHIDIESSDMGFKLAITTITTTSFTLELNCYWRRAYTLILRWFAFDDQRIQVLSNFNMENPDDKTFQIKNPNAQTGFLQLTSLRYTGQIDFLLSVIIIIIIDKPNYYQFSNCQHYQSSRKVFKSQIDWVFCRRRS
ncbi:unnamed protein product (macronuclear) [Paramecium tetraurelia]|uniref:H-type lectin domain-containing protein n=1 Tax=Paramecium tetraurelia TaxID=5888 RepID=A0DY28_PARTE|nr:uncharacterized protein GSPATT00021571001 [Paramecium tetraurelia]CAK87945.1 unnamed protein product [Paramecium tetraurelia]|eukprot:XP_001455342.1 hypothetical protein (macronuclear) [Paramecium tetraurelia strain d4-2]